MTGRGTRVTTPEQNELIAGLFQELEQGSHQPCALGVASPAETIEDTPHQSLYRLRITAYRTIGLATGSWKEHFGVVQGLLWDV